VDRSHLFNQLANLRSGGRPVSPTPLRFGQPRRESAEPFAPAQLITFIQSGGILAMMGVPQAPVSVWASITTWMAS